MSEKLTEDRKTIHLFMKDCDYGRKLYTYDPPVCDGCEGCKREFDADDMMAVKEAIDKAGKWTSFFNYTHSHYYPEDLDPIRDNVFACITGWLINPPRFCKLAAEWLRKEKVC